MRKRHCRVRGLALATVVVAAVAALATVPQTAASAAVERCPGGGPLVVNAYATFSNGADFGADGHVWALDAARASMQIWQVGTNTYCVKRQDHRHVHHLCRCEPGGDRHGQRRRDRPVERGDSRSDHGTFAPTVATSGFVGDFDGQCQQDGTCLGTRFNPRLYFSSIDSFEFFVFSATYEAGACGVWRQSLDGDTGDIVC